MGYLKNEKFEIINIFTKNLFEINYMYNFYIQFLIFKNLPNQQFSFS